jgi:hypothetical protein
MVDYIRNSVFFMSYEQNLFLHGMKVEKSKYIE